MPYSRENVSHMTTRKAVPLNEDEITAIDKARTSPALAELAGQSAVRSEASTLHALVMLGLAQVNERAQLTGYAALAASQDDEDRAYAVALRGRRRGGDDE
jgi:hypothetical protein